MSDVHRYIKKSFLKLKIIMKAKHLLTSLLMEVEIKENVLIKEQI